ncbi:hypothetical protein GY45DRAFT_488033 [Cubamyces sp. BRFM 1775]|nr:hypothetical protein GY45DRAFT_488033 [Cubamyces sp. BRFM 1775]
MLLGDESRPALRLHAHVSDRSAAAAPAHRLLVPIPSSAALHCSKGTYGRKPMILSMCSVKVVDQQIAVLEPGQPATALLTFPGPPFLVEYEMPHLREPWVPGALGGPPRHTRSSSPLYSPIFPPRGFGRVISPQRLLRWRHTDHHSPYVPRTHPSVGLPAPPPEGET